MWVAGGWWSKGILEFRFGQNLGLRLEVGTKMNKKQKELFKYILISANWSFLLASLVDFSRYIKKSTFGSTWVSFFKLHSLTFGSTFQTPLEIHHSQLQLDGVGIDFVFERREWPSPGFDQNERLYMSEIWCLSCGCLEGVWRVSGGCLQGVCRVSGWCLVGIYGMFKWSLVSLDVSGQIRPG